MPLLSQFAHDVGEALALDEDALVAHVAQHRVLLLQERGEAQVEGRLQISHRLQVVGPLAGRFELHEEGQRRRGGRGRVAALGGGRREDLEVGKGGGGWLDGGDRKGEVALVEREEKRRDGEERGWQ